jgi:hypothetical protein
VRARRGKKTRTQEEERRNAHAPYTPCVERSEYKGRAAQKGGEERQRRQGAMPEAISGGVRPSLGQLSDIDASVQKAGQGRKPMQSPCARVRP